MSDRIQALQAEAKRLWQEYLKIQPAYDAACKAWNVAQAEADRELEREAMRHEILQEQQQTNNNQQKETK